MVPKINDTCMILNLAKAIWIAIEETYSKAKDVAQIYYVKVKTIVAEQDTEIVIECDNQLRALWMEFDHYKVNKAKCYEDSANLRHLH